MTNSLLDTLRKEALRGQEYLYDYFIEEQLISPQLIERIRNIPKRSSLSSLYPYETKMNRSEYEANKKILQIELLKCQRWIKEEGRRVLMIFEGRDAAGKGGTIQRFTEHLNPRGARIVALHHPSEKEQGQWYFQRYIEHFPTKGEIVFFDRSWYNRAGVEHVMGFCTQDQYDDFMVHVPSFEQMLIDSNMQLYKFWFSVSREEQLRRFIARLSDPLKQWKISPIDIASLKLWESYTSAREAMFAQTDSESAPWTVILSDCKKRARLNAMKHFLLELPYPKKNLNAIGSIDTQLVGRPHQIYSRLPMKISK